MPGLLRQLDTLADDRVRGNPIEMLKLKRAQAQGDENLNIELRVRSGEEWFDLLVELDLPAQRTKHHHCCQIAIGLGECVYRRLAEQIVGVALLALHREQNPERGLACRTYSRRSHG